MTKDDLVKNFIKAVKALPEGEVPKVSSLFETLKTVAGSSTTNAEIEFLLQMRVCDLFPLDMQLWKNPINTVSGNPLESGSPAGRKQELGLEDTFPFGKYSGRTVEAVVEADPGYIVWFSENVERLRFSSTVLALVKGEQ
jgi:hypothetical protein